MHGTLTEAVQVPKALRRLGDRRSGQIGTATTGPRPLPRAAGGAASTPWVDALSYIFCSGRVAAFARTPTLCDGVTPYRSSPRDAVSRGGAPTGGQPFQDRTGPGARMETRWLVPTQYR